MYWIGFVFAFVLMVGWTLYQANKNRVLMLKDIALLVLASVFSWAAIVVMVIIGLMFVCENKDMVIWRKD